MVSQSSSYISNFVLIYISIHLQIWFLDRRLHPGLSGQLPADVDIQAGVRGVGQTAGRPQVPLNDCLFAGCHCSVAINVRIVQKERIDEAFEIE